MSGEWSTSSSKELEWGDKLGNHQENKNKRRRSQVEQGIDIY